MTHPGQKSTIGQRLSKNVDLIFTFGLFGVITLLVIPIPTIFLDLLLALSIGISLLILLIVIYLEEPSEFTVFPVILLAVTLFRLGLNIASTRLILIDGYAGQVIDSFGNFVVRGNYVVGAVVFTILVIINFVVITKGAGRIAEVAARFTLDSLPGKQMSIDAELNSGLIDEEAARTRRGKLQKEIEFYGAMDGASKFVRGDAMAGVLITAINVIGGICIGVFQKDLTVLESVKKFTLLSIGDGLVSQIPALIISVGAGILITRNSEGTDLGTSLGKQFKAYPRAISIGGVMLLIFGLLPGMPTMPFLTLAILCFLIARALQKQESKEKAATAVEKENQPAALESAIKPGSSEDLERLVKVDTLAVELGYGLLPLADKKQAGDLIERITGIRQKLARDLGIILPPISVSDNIDLENNQYRFILRGREVAIGTLFPTQVLAVNIGNSPYDLPGEKTKEPVFDIDSTWIGEDKRNEAEANGYTVVDPSSVLITHLSEVLRREAYLVLEREDVQKLLDITKEKNPTLVSELIPDKLSVGLLHRVLQNLLKERIAVKHFSVILEALGDFAGASSSPDDLAEHVRKKLGIYFVPEYEDQQHKIKALTLDPDLEQALIMRVRKTSHEITLFMEPNITREIIESLSRLVNTVTMEGIDPVLITSFELRFAFKKFFDPSFPRLTVLSFHEIPNSTFVESVGLVSVSPHILREQVQLPLQPDEPALA